MKKIVWILVFILTLSLFAFCTGCGDGEQTTTAAVTGEAAWNRFSSALELTSALEYYEIDTFSTRNGETVSEGKIILTKDEYDRTVAYREQDDEKMFWIEGIVYTQNGALKKKAPQSLDAFLQISETSIGWTYDMVQNPTLFGSEISFSFTKTGFDGCRVNAKIGTFFLNSITVTVKKTENAQTVESAMTYTYKNPGSKPSVTVPNDLDQYNY